MAAEEPPSESESKEAQKKPEPKKGWAWLSWERDVEILKIAVTFYAACIGTFVTFQFNERQHELNRIEAIAKMLPHLSEADKADSSDGDGEEASPAQPAALAPDPKSGAQTASPKKRKAHRMTRDGAIWAIFRTANNKTMLRDLAALFPEDIYRVVSSIAASGGLYNDDDALTALQVSSEKLANRYSSTNTVLAARLYNQALHLKQRSKGGGQSFPIVDLTDEIIDEPEGEDHIADMLSSLNQLGEIHKAESDSSDKVTTGRWNAKQMYKRVRQLGKTATSRKAKEQIIIADTALGKLYFKEHRGDTGRFYLGEAIKLSEQLNGKNDKTTIALTAELEELERAHKAAESASGLESHGSPQQ